MKIIGLSGTNGSGKDSLGYALAERYNFLFVSVSDLLRVECRHRGLEVNRENLRTLSAEWRRTFGPGVLVDKALELAAKSDQKYTGVIACPMRNVGEAQHLKDLGGTLIWVDADPHIRYQRVAGTNRGRVGEDDKTYEQFLAEEAVEMMPSDPHDPSILNMTGVKALADVELTNETTLEALEKAAAEALGLD